jgi:hypothetical protein
LASATKTKSTVEDEIVPLHKPRGEAGDKKRGFNLQDAMGLKNDDALYKVILVCLLLSLSPLSAHQLTNTQATTRRNVIAARLQPGVRFGQHDHEKLGQVFKLVRLSCLV